jgi:lipoyl(octanoyl) transferase
MQRQVCATPFAPRSDGASPPPDPDRSRAIEWLCSNALVEYETAVRWMERRVAAIIAGRAPEAIWLLEHPPIYTCGTSARDEELLDGLRFPVHQTGRGGRITYHGPGQRVGYVMLDLRRRGTDVHVFVGCLERWLIATLTSVGVTAKRCEGKIGVWVDRGARQDAKIAAIGIRVRRWISFHGFALNVAPDLSHFGGIIPCGLAGSAVTSLKDLGVDVEMRAIDSALRSTFERAFS